VARDHLPKPLAAGTMSDFDERSGLAYCRTPWGQWAQTVEDVIVEVQLQHSTRARDVVCDIKPRYLLVTVAGNEIFKAR